MRLRCCGTKRAAAVQRGKHMRGGCRWVLQHGCRWCRPRGGGASCRASGSEMHGPGDARCQLGRGCTCWLLLCLQVRRCCSGGSGGGPGSSHSSPWSRAADWLGAHCSWAGGGLGSCRPCAWLLGLQLRAALVSSGGCLGSGSRLAAGWGCLPSNSGCWKGSRSPPSLPVGPGRRALQGDSQH